MYVLAHGVVCRCVRVCTYADMTIHVNVCACVSYQGMCRHVRACVCVCAWCVIMCACMRVMGTSEEL